MAVFFNHLPPSWKRRFSFGVIFVWMFISGIEYAVVFPTLWEYLQSLGTPPEDVYFLGVCISAVVVTDMFMGLVVGRYLDKVNRVSRIILFFNAFQIAGSSVYFFARTPLWILASRLISGLGNSASVSFLTDVCRSTSVEERTPILLLFSIAQQLGLLLGPACNLFLRLFDFSIWGYLPVNKLTSPGFFMAIIYIVFQLVVFLFYFDLSPVAAEMNAFLSDSEEEDECESESESESQEDPQNEVVIRRPPPVGVTWKQYVDEVLLKNEIIALVSLRFISLFGQTCLETIATPVMKMYFNYEDFENSLLFLFSGIELLIVFMCLSLASKRISDQALILVGIFLHTLTYIWYLGFFPQAGYDDLSNLPYFAIFVILDLISIPILMDITLALSTKLLRNEVQGFATGVRRFISGVAFLLGPLWGSATLPWPTVLGAVPLALHLLFSGLFILSYKKMKQSIIDAREPGERTPLLS